MGDRAESIIGWREWLSLPGLNIARIKAKIDTGARSSTLHALNIEYFDQGDLLKVRFKVHPLQRDRSLIVEASAPVLEKRCVRNSGGAAQERPVIRTFISLGTQQWPIDLTLTNRDVMGFRMLLGREAVRHRFLVDPGRSYLSSEPHAGEPYAGKLNGVEPYAGELNSAMSYAAEIDGADLP